MKSVVAVAVGGIVAALAYWVGAVIALLAVHGIPLGSPGGGPTAADILVHLLLAVAGSLAGSLVAMRIATHRRQIHAIGLGLLLGVVALLGFSKPANNWPAWFGGAMCAACILGSAAASFSRADVTSP